MKCAIKIYKNYFTVIYLFFNITFLAQYQNYEIEYFTEVDGLSHACISCIYQDSKGFIWIGTENGLNKYDGYNFTEYINDSSNPKSLSSNFIRVFYEDPADSGKILWIGTRGGGLNQFNLELEEFIAFQHNPSDPTSISNNDVQCIYKDKYENLWIGTDGGGLNKFNKETGKFFSYQHNPKDSNSISNNFVFAIHQDKNDNLWVGNARYGGLNKFDYYTERFTHYKYNPNDPYSLPFNGVYAIYEDSYGELWIGTFSGICKYDSLKDGFIEQRFNPNFSPILRDYNIWNIIEDKSKNLWFTTTKNGLFKVNSVRDRILHIRKDENNPNSISGNNISSICIDRSGIIWVGTYCYGINKLTHVRSNFVIYKNNKDDLSSLSNNWISSICEDQNQNLWIGTQDGLNKYDIRTRKFSKYQFGAYRGISKVASAKDGTIWIAREYSLTHFNPISETFINYYDKNYTYNSLVDSTVKNFQKTNLESERSVHHVYIDKNNKILCIIGRLPSEKRLYTFDSNSQRFLLFKFSEDSLNSFGITSFSEDRSGNYLFGLTNNCVVLLPNLNLKKTFNQKINIIALNPSKSESIINTIHEDSKGIYWIGTNNMLYKWNPATEQLYSYGKKNGLPSNLVLGILEDDFGNIWISTDKGISKFYNNTNKFRNYDEKDDLPILNFGQGAFFKSSIGKMYFGGIEGLLTFHPDSLFENQYVPSIIISDFKLFNKSVSYGTKSPFKSNINYSKELILNYDQNLFSLEFSSLDYTYPKKNEYAYKLQGFHEDWINNGNNRTATFTNLDPGEYIFRVKGSNNDGVWNEEGTSLAIIILPPWWATWWFRTIAGFFFFSTIVVLHKLRVKRLKDDRTKQEQFSKKLIQSQEEERKRIAGELHDSLGQNLMIIHNRIQYFFKGKKELPAELEPLIPEVKETIEEVREIARNLHPHQLEQLGLTKAIESVIRKTSRTSEIKFTTKIEFIDKFLAKEEWIHVYRIIQEALTNIIKHSSASEVRVSLVKKWQKIILEISDNGKGMNLVKENSNHGFGIQNIRERAKLLNAQLEIDSSVQKGVKIFLQIPI